MFAGIRIWISLLSSEIVLNSLFIEIEIAQVTISLIVTPSLLLKILILGNSISSDDLQLNNPVIYPFFCVSLLSSLLFKKLVLIKWGRENGNDILRSIFWKKVRSDPGTKYERSYSALIES